MSPKQKPQRGRDSSGKKLRWSQERKDREKQQIYAEAIGKARQLVPAGTPGASFATPKAKSRGASGPRTPAAAPPKKRRRKAAKERPKVVERSGDVVCEHNWDTSEDEEEMEIAEAKRKQKEEELAAEAKGRRQIFVSGIPWTADEEGVKKYFSKCGKIEEVAYPRTEMGRPKGIAFVTFPDEDCVARALALDGADWEARKLSVKVARSKKKKGSKGKGKGKNSDSEDDSDDDEDDDSHSFYDDGSGSDDGSDSSGKGKGKSKGKGKGKGKAGGKGKGGKGKAKRSGKGGGGGKKRQKGRSSGKKRKR